MRSLGFVIVLLALLLVALPTAAQDDAPFLPDDLVPITAENASSLAPLTGLGNGRLIDLLATPQGELVAVTTAGAVIYPSGDINADPRLVRFNPGPYDNRPAPQGLLMPEATLSGRSIQIQGYKLDLDTGETIALNTADDRERVPGLPSPDGRIIARTDQLRDPGDPQLLPLEGFGGMPLATLELGTRGRVNQTGFSDDSSRLYVSGLLENPQVNNGETVPQLQIWNVADGTLAAAFPLLEALGEARFRLSGGLIFVSGRGGGGDITRVIDAQTLADIGTYPSLVLAAAADRASVFALQEDPESRTFDLQVIDTASGQVRSQVPGALCSMNRLGSTRAAVSPDSTRLYLGNVGDGPILAYDLTTDPPALLGRAGDFRLIPTGVAFSADGRRMFVSQEYTSPACTDHPDIGVHVYDRVTGDKLAIWEMPGEDRLAHGLALGLDGDREIVAVAAAQGVSFFQDGVPLGTDSDPDWGLFVDDLTASPDGTSFAAIVRLGSEDRSDLIVWNSSGQRRFSIPGVSNDFWGQNVILTDSLLIHAEPATDQRGQIINPRGDVVVRDSTGRELQRLALEFPITGMAYAPQAGRLLVTAGDRRGRVRDTYVFTLSDDGTLQPEGFFGTPNGAPIFAISPDGQLAAFVTLGGDQSSSVLPHRASLLVYDLETGGLVSAEEIWGDLEVAFDPEGLLIYTLSGGSDLTLFGVRPVAEAPAP